MYELCRLVQVFDPQCAAAHLTPAWVDSLAVITPLAHLADLTKMKAELHVYLAACQGVSLARNDVDIYSDGWRANGPSFPA